jgi:hypothetical protein
MVFNLLIQEVNILSCGEIQSSQENHPQGQITTEKILVKLD